MFEKVADKIAKDIYIHHFDDDINYPCVLKAIAVGVQKGAEHAYNKAKVEVEESYRESLCNSELNLASVTEQLEELEKANEWHKVADGDLPKAYQKCYFIYSNRYKDNGKIDFSESSVNVLTGIYAFYLDEETGEETADPCFYDDINDEEIILSEVYAWKEIILPELKESE